MKININSPKINVTSNKKNIDLKLGMQTVNEAVADYEVLENKPSINYVTLIGNKTLDDLDIQVKGDYADEALTNQEIEDLINSFV